MRLASPLLLLMLLVSSSAAQPHSPRKKGVDIFWDTWGVPHIFAETATGMFWGSGWAQAEAHGDLLLETIAASRGRSAEFFGAGAGGNNVENDRSVLLNEVPQRAAKWLQQQHPEFRAELEAFAGGINAYAKQHPEALCTECRNVLPVKAVDVIARSQAALNYEFMTYGRFPVPERPSQTATLTPSASVEEREPKGSNGWAIAPSRSADGKAMLLANPHLEWGGRDTLFEMQLVGPGVNVYGATVVGFPSPIMGFTPQAALTWTVNTTNGALFYRIEEKDGGYVYDGAVRKYEQARYSFKVLQKDGNFTTETVNVRKTVHGPIVSHTASGPIAMLIPGLDKPFVMEQTWKMLTAPSLAAYQNQLRRLELPMFNLIYADRDGHIAYNFNANVPVRSEGNWDDWLYPVAGNTSRLLPRRSLTYDQLPKLIDPPSAHVQNSNQPPWDAAWPTMIDHRAYPPYLAPADFAYFRSDRGIRMLNEELTPDEKMTFDMLLQKKLSTRAEFADRILPDLLAAVDQYGTPRAKQAAAVLKAWDRETEADSRGALLFSLWAQLFVNPAVDTTDSEGQRNFAVPYDVSLPLTTPRGLKDPKAAAEMLDAAADKAVKVYGALDRPWGDVMRLQINGQSDANFAAERGSALNGVDLPGNGGPGGIGVFRVVSWGPLLNGRKTPVAGDTFTLAMEFTTPIKAKVLTSYGNCSQPACLHHTDQLPLFAHKQWRDVFRETKDIEQHLEKRESF